MVADSPSTTCWSDASSLVFAATGTQTLNFAHNATNLTPFERVGSLAGGSVTSTINLTVGGNVAAFAFGADNTSTTFAGTFLPGSSAGTLIKEGTGTFTWNNPTGDTWDGIFDLRAGGLTTGAQGLDGATALRMSNGTTFTNGANDTIAVLEGGSGVSRIQPTTNFVGALYGNHVAGGAPSAVINTGTVLTVSSATTGGGFNGVISGAGGLTKGGSGVLQLFGANTYTGETNVNGGTLTLGVLSRSAGVGTVSGSDIRGSLADTGVLNITGGTFNLNGLSETVAVLRNSTGAGTLALVNGSLDCSGTDHAVDFFGDHRQSEQLTQPDGQRGHADRDLHRQQQCLRWHDQCGDQCSDHHRHRWQSGRCGSH